MERPEERQTVATQRLTDLIREAGTLLLAFAPLDYMLLPELDPMSLFGFLVIGVCLFRLAVIREVRRLP